MPPSLMMALQWVSETNLKTVRLRHKIFLRCLHLIRLYKLVIGSGPLSEVVLQREDNFQVYKIILLSVLLCAGGMDAWKERQDRQLFVSLPQWSLLNTTGTA